MNGTENGASDDPPTLERSYVSRGTALTEARAETARLREALDEIKYYALDWSDRYASQEVWWDVVKKIQRMATVGASRPKEGQ